MKKQFYAGLLALLLGVSGANALGWPADYQGVMLQGFSWDSYTDTKWTNLTSQVDELSKYFNLIWVPNSGNCGGGNNMGYMPQYWFTNHNSSFGTEAELLAMIKAYKEKGTGFIADCVINHRVGVTNWTDFPAEEWNGQIWKIGTDGICSTDEVKDAQGQAKPTGAPDTGDDFNGARDLDHTNANVQNNCKNYVKCLQEKYGYAGMRYDMVKGYGGQYTKIYNTYANVQFSVGEYWDASYDAVAGWINATGKTSAAFDFPCKYAINEAFANNDMTKLVWRANGTTPQPAGMIHYGYSQYAVTFVDNHDTYRDGSKFNGNVPAANAFILMSPGTPCVFLPHYKQYKNEIQTLINVRNSVGVHNNSAVNVLRTQTDCYMAEITGKNGKVVVKIGSASVSPSGYDNADIVASGNDYCVWTKVKIGGDRPENPDTPDDPIVNPDNCVSVYFDNSAAGWTTPYIHYWGEEESAWPGNAMTKVGPSTWLYACPNGTTGHLFNAGDGDNTKTDNQTTGHLNIYNQLGLIGSYLPEKMYVIGNLKVSGGNWSPNRGVEMKREGDKYVADVVLVAPPAAAESRADDVSSYFSFVTKLATTDGDWDTMNSGDRFGASAKDAPLTVNTPAMMERRKPGEDNGGTYAWKVAPGTYTVSADFANHSITFSNKETTLITQLETEQEGIPVYYTLQGMRVENPVAGNIYIVVRGTSVSKQLFR